jgi:hypothetical protein
MPYSEGCSGRFAAVEGELGSPSEGIVRCIFVLIKMKIKNILKAHTKAE